MTMANTHTIRLPTAPANSSCTTVQSDEHGHTVSSGQHAARVDAAVGKSRQEHFALAALAGLALRLAEFSPCACWAAATAGK
jgi:hypothetical protein